MSTVGGRLKKEREGSGMTQDRFAAKAGIALTSQRNYEANRTAPNSDYLQAISSDVDITYILTGKRTKTTEDIVEMMVTMIQLFDEFELSPTQWRGLCAFVIGQDREYDELAEMVAAFGIERKPTKENS